MTQPVADSLAARLDSIRTRIARAAERSGRLPGAVRLVGVSKTAATDRLLEAVACGLSDVGESRVQEAEPKIAALAEAGDAVRPTWHFVGHLQSNKARRAVALFDWIQTVDSMRLAEALDRHAAEFGRRLRVLVEVNVVGEHQKAGVAPAEAFDLAESIARLPRLEVRGYMTVGPRVERPEEARASFRALARLLAEARELRPDLALDELSMGMSRDFEVAIEEGATQVRVGTELFGARS